MNLIPFNSLANNNINPEGADHVADFLLFNSSVTSFEYVNYFLNFINIFIYSFDLI